MLNNLFWMLVGAVIVVTVPKAFRFVSKLVKWARDKWKYRKQLRL